MATKIKSTTTKKKQSKSTISRGTKILGVVSPQYVAMNVPESQIEDVANMLIKAIFMSYLQLERVTELDENFE